MMNSIDETASVPPKRLQQILEKCFEEWEESAPDDRAGLLERWQRLYPAEYELIALAFADLIAMDWAGDDTEAGLDRTPVPGLFPRFVLTRPHKAGGLGMVFKAHDAELGREVAVKEIKEIHKKGIDGVELLPRFVREAEITGSLEHPGIVPVYGMGRYADGWPYYAMRFIRGEDLEDAVGRHHAPEGNPRRSPQNRRLEFRQLLRRFVNVCDTIEYAHSRGVIHRDLKPANVMLGPYGETMVVDWGLARVLGRDADGPSGVVPASAEPPGGWPGTQAGQQLGTLAYMSPEQADGRSHEAGIASDVYSLGGTLYCILTGSAPIEGETKTEVYRKILEGEITPPRRRKRRQEIHPGLAAICMKALALRPEDRYASARDLAEDVERWLADEPITARREWWTTRLRRWAGRHPAGTAAALTLLVGAVTLVGVLRWREQAQLEESIRVAEAELAQAERKAAEAREETDLGAWTEAMANAQRAVAALDGADHPLTRRATEAHAAIRSEADRARQGLALFEQALREVKQLKVAESLESLRSAAGLLPDNARIHLALAQALHDVAVAESGVRGAGGRREELRSLMNEAAVALHRSITLDPGNDEAHIVLIDVSQHLGQLNDDGVIASLRREVGDHPGDPKRRLALAQSLAYDKSRLDERVVLLREAVELAPEDPQALCMLGLALVDKGEYHEALAHLTKGHQIGTRIPFWPLPSAMWLQECQLLIDLKPKLPEFLAGRVRPANPEEKRAYARLCFDAEMFARASDLYESIIPDEFTAGALVDFGPDLTFALPAAVFAGEGRGQDASMVAEEVRTSHRQRAIVWVRKFVDFLETMTNSGPMVRTQVGMDLRGLLAEPALASVRDKSALERLPAEEREQWESLWEDTSSILESMQDQDRVFFNH